ncbi:MAG: O-antigen ligase family protein [Pyrinomonadaceae bacterium]|nr:O-antigen ligase family protein [Pyrinomonadaceae bacterium]MCX7640277.1 O-antigen ligase family protein [Pyrinomonadaceae bacterium]MDW8305275.1 O-antigen ligase family protein [Acidobacteriota bacterium]
MVRAIEELQQKSRLEIIAFSCLFLMVLFSPHSIAASQTAWLIGMFFLLARFLVKPKLYLQRTPLDLPLLAFFLWSVVSSVFSYTPLISIDKLRSVAIFLVFYFVIALVKSSKTSLILCFVLIASCMINVLYVPVERIIGRGVEIHGLKPESPLAKALLMDGDTLLKANDKVLKTPEELVEEISKNEKTTIFFYRPDFYYSVQVNREDLLEGESAKEKLGIQSWKKSHNWRSTGFFGHWTTYADVLQLIASLTFGFLVIFAERLPVFSKNSSNFTNFDLKAIATLLICFLLMAFALILSGTRAPQAGLAFSALLIVLLSRNKKMIFALMSVLIPAIIVVSIYLHESRKIGFIDPNDDSTKYRQTVYREALQLWVQSPRHIIFGIGMDSVRVYAKEWRLFDDGKLPLGHFHSTPIQILVERGLPALLIWLWIIWAYTKLLLKAIRKKAGLEKGALLGIFGGFVGFILSGLVHYNLGDQEVAMIFFLLMGLAFVLQETSAASSQTSTFASGKKSLIKSLIFRSSPSETAT